MCGRYTIITKQKECKGSVRAARMLEQAQADNHFNAAPIQLLQVITNEDPEHQQFFS
ncbi:hypothetical protein GCM10027443_43400 [Pontibacter brevis]